MLTVQDVLSTIDLETVMHATLGLLDENDNKPSHCA